MSQHKNLSRFRQSLGFHLIQIHDPFQRNGAAGRGAQQAKASGFDQSSDLRDRIRQHPVARQG
ncbi:hypothetical protein RUA8715_03709 [Ruegeria arenilitoris]|uniref:Uncharacterized protein n=1 Tax=Ruegeria arenilitoris TaxID=1173585 RepID=A0A238L2F9_9RHOB|nr:hypothetical protein RUA8715_03709 [Ruegeria arenilitoris]